MSDEDLERGRGRGEREKNTVVQLKNSLQIFPTQQFDEYTLVKRKGKGGRGQEKKEKKQTQPTALWTDACMAQRV